MLPFWTCFRPCLLLSSLSLARTCCFWVMDHRLNNFCAAEECISLFTGEVRVCIKLQMISPEQAGPGDRRKNICVISLQLTTGMSSLPSSMCSGCHQQLSLWDIIWGGSHILMCWFMSYVLHKYSLNTFSALNNDLCWSIIQDLFLLPSE